MKTSIPERIYVERDDRGKYSKIRQRLGKKFYLADIFSLAMIYGYMYNVRIPLRRKEGLFRTVSARDNFYSLMIMLYILGLRTQCCFHGAGQFCRRRQISFRLPNNMQTMLIFQNHLIP